MQGYALPQWKPLCSLQHSAKPFFSGEPLLYPFWSPWFLGKTEHKDNKMNLEGSLIYWKYLFCLQLGLMPVKLARWWRQIFLGSFANKKLSTSSILCCMLKASCLICSSELTFTIGTLSEVKDKVHWMLPIPLAGTYSPWPLPAPLPVPLPWPLLGVR